MKSIIISLLVIFPMIVISAPKKHKVTIHGGGDIVSSYIWRGSYNAGASIQPSLSMNVAGFSLAAWGSTDFAGRGKKEVDLSISYTWKDLKVGITDYWWAGEETYRYFNYSKVKTSHLFEGNILYQLPIEKFPLIISWNTIFAGYDYNEKGGQNYSTYIELNYPFAIGKFNMQAAVGFVPWTSPSFLAIEDSGFSVCNVFIRAERAIKCSETFSIPLFSQLIFNPALQDIYFVFGVSLMF